MSAKVSSKESSVFKRPEQLSAQRQAPAKFDIKTLAECHGPTETIEDLLNNPLKCGYLLAFCESEFSAENMRYILEIDRFKDTMKIDTSAWNSTLDWTGIDALLAVEQGIDMALTEEEIKAVIEKDDLVVGKESMWPSKKVHFEPVYQDIQYIWDNYLSLRAPHQICMPSKVLINTKHRLENLHLYGGSVFDETLIDPIKTLRKDTLPRFLASPLYKKMLDRLSSLDPLPDAKSLQLPLPSTSPTTLWNDDDIVEEKLVEIPMSEVVHDRILYVQFLNYCKTIFADENLLCGRAISNFKYSFGDKAACSAEAEDMAWIIFRYFAAPGSVYEVSISHRRRKEIMLTMASPKIDMFFRMEDSSHQMIRVHWINFSKIKLFSSLPKLIIDAKNKKLAEDQNVNSNKPIVNVKIIQRSQFQTKQNMNKNLNTFTKFMNTQSQLIARVFTTTKQNSSTVGVIDHNNNNNHNHNHPHHKLVSGRHRANNYVVDK